ncbi:Trehalose utilization [Luteitalea pratensis]|uniref:Trehalose utilization n=1 Tax=Luteitalea pratensis TaxID=1855912 RepID=A0A143PW20_LUTPR|nr:ThuA domain-containing protein [Luteitalea pratensis]AMY12024.1 Trehalose utilization [Luteitalea pratensis]
MVGALYYADHTVNSVLPSIVGVAWLLVGPGVLAVQPTAAPRPRVLAFFTAGGELDHVLFAQQAMRALTAGAADGGYAFAATTDWEALNDTNLRDVGLVIWLNDMPRTPAQRQAFERYMAGGGAWLGFHVSGFGTAAWPWFTEFMGGSRFAASNWPSLPARVNVDDAGHPIVKGTPPTFVAPINEWYAWTPSPRANPDVKVLLTLDASNFPLGVKNTLNGGDVPVAWINTRFRMVYLNYGHGDRIYSTPVLPAMIDNSVRFLLDRGI